MRKEDEEKNHKLLSQSAVHWNKAENNDKSALKPKRHETNMLPNGKPVLWMAGKIEV